MDLSHFSLDNEVKTSFEIGDLVPFSWLDVVPGDQIKASLTSLVRLQPLIAPVMHSLKFYTRWYYVPYRLLMKNFEKMLIDPDSPLVCPTLYDVHSKLLSSNLDSPFQGFVLDNYNLLRLFGIHSDDGTINSEALKVISAFPFFAYQLIYNYFYKDPILDDTYKDDFDPSLDFDFQNILTIRRVRYLKDYFTSSLPSTQYGSEVSLDMDGNNVIKVNEMRLAEKLQLFKEKLLLHGARYLDFLRSFFDTAPSSQVLQQPQYLGGGISNINISDVDQMVGDEFNPLGNVAGKSASVVGDNGYSETFKEHGIVLGLCFIKPEQSYISGIPRSFIKRDFYSFYNPTFANIGMQEVYGCELSANRSDTFGYNERYAELKYNPSVVCSDFASTLKHWHFGRDTRRMVLNNSFLLVDENTIPFAVRKHVFSYNYFTDFSFYYLSGINSSSGISQEAPSSYFAFGVSGLTDFGSEYTLIKEYKFSEYAVVFKNVSGSYDFYVIRRGLLPPVFYEDSPLPFELFIHSFDNDFKKLLKEGFSSDYDYKFYLTGLSYLNYNIPVFHTDAGSYYLVHLFGEGYSPALELNGEIGSGFHASNLNPLIMEDRGFTRIDDKVFSYDKRERVFNHVIAVFGNNIEALRPVPKSDRYLI